MSSNDQINITSPEEAPAPRQTGRAKKRRVPLALKIVLVLLLLIGLIGCSAMLYLDSKLDKLSYNANEDTPMKTGEEFTAVYDDYTFNTEGMEQRESAAALPSDDPFSDQNIINILLIGTDKRLVGTSDLGRADANMIVSLNKATGEIKLISFERAIGVPIPGYGDEMLNAAFQYGGGEFQTEIISRCFLVDFAGYVHVSYEMFPDVIDAIGGIDLELERNEVHFMARYLQYTSSGDDLKVGMNHLDGLAAYSFCRLRDDSDDFVRQGRTRDAVEAVINQVKTLSLLELNELVDTVMPMIDTNLSKSQIKSLIAISPNFLNPQFSQMMVPESEEETWSYLGRNNKPLMGCDFETHAAEIKEFIYGK